MSDTVHPFEAVELPRARTVTPEAGSDNNARRIPADAQVSRLVAPNADEKLRKRRPWLLAGTSVLAAVMVSAVFVGWKLQGVHGPVSRSQLFVRHMLVAPATPSATSSPVPPAAAPEGQPAGMTHGPGALRAPAEERPGQGVAPGVGSDQQPVPVVMPAQPMMAPSASQAADQAAAPAPSVPPPAEPPAATADVQRLLNSLVARIGQLEEDAKREATDRKAAFEQMQEKSDAVAATVNREAGRLDEISSRLNAIGTITPAATALVSSTRTAAPTEESPPAPRRMAPRAMAAVPSEAPAPKTAVEHRPRYTVDAGAPTIAEVQTASGQVLEVHPGDVLPGYGHINSIEQVGNDWVVNTDRGTVR